MVEQIEFYRANGKYGFLSNLYPCYILIEINNLGSYGFTSSEAAYQWRKIRDHNVAAWLLSAPDQCLLAVTAHNLPPRYVVAEWSVIKVAWMRKVVYEKFDQNKDLLDKLLATGDVEIIEASKTDSFWGIGRDGKGQNMLGKILMETREKFRIIRKHEGVTNI